MTRTTEAVHIIAAFATVSGRAYLRAVLVKAPSVCGNLEMVLASTGDCWLCWILRKYDLLRQKFCLVKKTQRPPARKQWSRVNEILKNPGEQRLSDPHHIERIRFKKRAIPRLPVENPRVDFYCNKTRSYLGLSLDL